MNGGKVVLESGITLSDEKDKVVIEISGDAFKNLREITDFYNKGESEEDCLSPAEIVHTYMLATDDWYNLHQKQPDEGSINNLCGNIIEGVKSEYAASLERDFNLAGFSVIH